MATAYHDTGRGAGGGGGAAARRAIAPQDLLRDPLVANAPRTEYEGAQRPTLGGVHLLTKLGQGGMGAVYYGFHPRLEIEVAVKVLPFNLAERSPELVERFFREARIAARVKSPNLVNILDVNEEGGLFYHVLEFVHGPSAGSYLRQLQKEGQTGLPLAAALDVCIAATIGLAAAHKHNVVHRDVKPDNILLPLAEDGVSLDFPSAKLADLGLARDQDFSASLTGALATMGTPGYMAPEQTQDARSAGKPADVFSMGATLHACLSGYAPFRGSSAFEVMSKTIQARHDPLPPLPAGVAEPVQQLVDQCLEKEPARRFTDAAALLAALYTCRSASGAAAAPAGNLAPTMLGPAPVDDVPLVTPSDLPRPAPAAPVTWATPAPTTPYAPAPPASAGAPPSTHAAYVTPAPAPPARRSSVVGFIVAAVVLVLLCVAGGLGYAAWRAFGPGDRGPKRQGSQPGPAASGEALAKALPAARAAKAKGDWAKVREELEAPLRALGTQPHPDRTAAEELLAEAQTETRKAAGFDAAIREADRLLAAGSFAEAERAYADAKASARTAPQESQADEGLTKARRGASDRKYDTALAAGQQALKERRWSKAKLEFEAALELRPGDPAALQGLSEVEAGTKSEHYETVLSSGQQALRERQWTKAEDQFRLALSMRPNDASAQQGLRDAQTGAGSQRYDQAILEGDRLLAQKVPDAAGAEAAFRRALAEKKDDEVALRGLKQVEWATRSARYQAAVAEGQQALTNQQWSLAAEKFQAALKERPGDAAAQQGLTQAAAHSKDGRYRAALEEGDAFLNRRPPDVAAAEAAFNRALVEKPDDPAALGGLTRVANARTEAQYQAAMLAANGELNTETLDREGLYSGLSDVKRKRVVADIERALQLRPGDKAALALREKLGTQRTISLDLGEGVKLDLVFVPAGKFNMGSTDDAAQAPVHEVTLTHPYYIGKYPVTLGQFKRFVADTGFLTLAERQASGAVMTVSGAWRDMPGMTWKKPGYTYQTDDHPVAMIAWGDAQEFAKWASQTAKRAVRLPSEAEWEYAARGPQGFRYAWGNLWDGKKCSYAGQECVAIWKCAYAGPDNDGFAFTTPVGHFKNASWCGAYDMGGNVWQWCWDWYEKYPATPLRDPRGPLQGERRVFRGNSWAGSAAGCTTTYRGADLPTARRADYGFRVVAPLFPPKAP